MSKYDSLTKGTLMEKEEPNTYYTDSSSGEVITVPSLLARIAELELQLDEAVEIIDNSAWYVCTYGNASNSMRLRKFLGLFNTDNIYAIKKENNND